MGEFLSQKLRGLVQSDIRAMSRECNRVGGINLGQGICDLPTPPAVARGAIDAIRDNKSTYSYSEGLPELREALSVKLAEHNAIKADPSDEIVVTVGASGAFTAALSGLLNPGDGVLVMEPYYGYHVNAALVAGMSIHYLTLKPPRFALIESELLAALKPNTRAIVICSPANPSGKMFSRDELEVVSRVANQHDLLVITDEIYEYIRFDGREHVSAGSLPTLWDRTVTIMGLSKTFSITGWRLGYAVAPKALVEPMTLVNDLHYVCPPTPLQYGALAGCSVAESFYIELRTDYQRKRDLLCSALRRAGMPPIVPEGAYYILADISELGYPGAREAAMGLLAKCGVAAIPGTAFYRGPVGQTMLRFCFAKDDSVLHEACKRLSTVGAA